MGYSLKGAKLWLRGAVLPLLGATLMAAQTTPISPQEIMGHILSRNEAFVNKHEASYFQGFKSAQHPYITMVGCSDSRAHSVAFSDPVDHIFSIRNIGNQMHNNFGSVDYGVYHLKTPILLLMGHTHCGAIEAAMHNYSAESFATVREIDHLAIPLRFLVPKAPIAKDVFEKLWLEGVERNVDYQVQVALKRYEKKIAAGQLTVVGAVYDFLNAYQSGEGRLVIININGETDPKNLKSLSFFSRVSDTIKAQTLKRFTQPHLN